MLHHVYRAFAVQIQELLKPTITRDYKLEETIGTGKYSRVKRAIVKATGKEVAIKIISFDNYKNDEQVHRHRCRGSVNVFCKQFIWMSAFVVSCW